MPPTSRRDRAPQVPQVFPRLVELVCACTEAPAARGLTLCAQAVELWVTVVNVRNPLARACARTQSDGQTNRPIGLCKWESGDESVL